MALKPFDRRPGLAPLAMMLALLLAVSVMTDQSVSWSTVTMADEGEEGEEGPSNGNGEAKGKDKKGDREIPAGTPPALETIPVPLPPNLDEFVRDRDAAILLGKALFWDIQVGSDGKTACASCHFHAGVDNRTRNTLAPGAGTLRSTNYDLVASDFPFHRLQDPDRKRSDDNPVVFDTAEIVGSQGVVKKDFVSINETGSAVDAGPLTLPALHPIDGTDRGLRAPAAIPGLTIPEDTT